MARHEERKPFHRTREQDPAGRVPEELRKLSSGEIRAYFDAVEPVADGEVEEILGRVRPGLIERIDAAGEKRAPGRAHPARRAVALAACLLIALSALAQAMGAPIWQSLVRWTRDLLVIDVSSDGDAGARMVRTAYSEAERAAWGDEVCRALEEMGTCPPLPTWKGAGYELADLYNTGDESGYAYVDALYLDAAERALKLTLEVLPSDAHAYALGMELDGAQGETRTLDGTQYYFASNRDWNSVSWRYENVVYQIGGNLGFDELEKMVRSIRCDG